MLGPVAEFERRELGSRRRELLGGGQRLGGSLPLGHGRPWRRWRRRLVGGIVVQQLEHLLPVPIPGDRFDETLRLQLGARQRLHIGLHLRRQFLAVALPEVLEPALLLLELLPRVGELGLEEPIGRTGQCAAIPNSASACISGVRIWNSTHSRPGPTTVVCSER